MSETIHLTLPYLAAAQAQKHVTHNEALKRLDAVVQLAVIDTTLAAPPGSPDEGDRYIIAAGATGAWAGHDGEVAAFVDGAWLTMAAEEGWLAYDASTETLLLRQASGWTAVGTSPDAVLGPASATDSVPVLFDGTTGKLIKATTFASFKTALALVKADVGLGSVLNLPQREKLTASRTYYVRTDGSDSNDGLANNAGGAFLTIAKAMAVVAGIDLGGFVATIQVGAGTWTTAVTLPVIVGGTAVLLGDTATPANVTISLSSGSCVTAEGVIGWAVRGFKLVTSGARGVLVRNFSSLTVSHIEFGACTLGHTYCGYNSVLFVETGCTITGNAPYHWLATSGGQVVCQSVTITLSGTPAFSTAFATASVNGSMNIPSITFSGSATGTRYYITLNAVISTGGGGASYLPGSAAGSTLTGGQYQ